MLQKTYYNPKHPGSYGGIDALHRNASKELTGRAKLSRGDVEKW